MKKRFEPRKENSWWCVFDTHHQQYSTLICFGKYKTEKDCQDAINRFFELANYINKGERK